jgi:hypothetical protein
MIESNILIAKRNVLVWTRLSEEKMVTMGLEVVKNAQRDEKL